MRSRSGMLVFDRKFIRRSAKEKLRSTNLAEIFFKQAISEVRFLLRNKTSFRKRTNFEALRAYRAMDSVEFELINARQQWANWRLIPKNLSGHVPAAPMCAIDLCCGTGQSTEVLGWYLPKGSWILGLEYNPEFVRLAQAREYRHHEGEAADVNFRTQSVLEPFRTPEGELIEDSSIDLINSCGAVGCHFDRAATETLAREVSRVLKPGGLATIDSGAPGTKKSLLVDIFESCGFEVVQAKKSVFLDPYTQVCFRKPDHQAGGSLAGKDSQDAWSTSS
ncbi:MAG TPA: class I SAM-dependent methyltransferase [Bdellovibrionota bacterium]|nr:class I SAM-dependent methyltransferase [Bdellovibrionota bacterium]